MRSCPGVKTLELAKKEGEAYAGTSPDEVLAGKYPLARFLYLYVNKEPNKELDPLRREFIRYISRR